MFRTGLWLLVGALSVCACSSDQDGDTNQPLPDATPELDADQPDALPDKDATVFVVHDGGGPRPCSVTCDCPQGLACVDSACTSLGAPVWCCDKRGCPQGQQCLDQDDRADVCLGDPDPGDGGVGVDTGPGQVGDYCEMDQDCDPTLGLSCWERSESPYIWGYCTLIDCTPDCPMGSVCIRFNGTPVTIGCMEGCNVDGDCRSDAFCLPVQDLTPPFMGVCIPDCRDDFYDCSADGSSYCNPATGQCAATPSHDANARIGDPCLNSTQCAAGDICLGEFAWRFEDGMCTHVCDGLPEESPCPVGSSCQYLPPPNDQIGLCFRDCTGANCPDRPGAVCDVLDPSWIDPSCIPPILP